MEYLAISLAYDKHTAETIEAQIANYHDINYEKRKFTQSYSGATYERNNASD